MPRSKWGSSLALRLGPYSDVFGWAKTCCFGLFKTTQPLPKHWQSIPQPLASLLEDCLAENPQDRPSNFKKVLERLSGVALHEPMRKGERRTKAAAARTAKPRKLTQLRRPQRRNPDSQDADFGLWQRQALFS